MVANGQEVYNASRNISEKLGHLSVSQGKDRTEVPRLHAGDIGCVAKLKNTHTNDTLSTREQPVRLPDIRLPEPLVTFAVHASARGDEEKVQQGLHRLHDEDPTFTTHYDPETHETIVARHRPLVVITSNNEKELPDAFLRRCFFHYIRFPDRETMTRIVDVHFPGLKKALLAEALEVFFELREVPGLKKKPSTSELLDWLKLLLAEDIPPEALHSSDRKVVVPPLHGALLKNEQDVHLFERVAFMARAGR